MRTLLIATTLLTLLWSVQVSEGFIQPQFQETGRSRRKARATGDGGPSPSNAEGAMGDGTAPSSNSYYSTAIQQGGELQLKFQDTLRRGSAVDRPKGNDCWYEAVGALQTSCDKALRERGFKSRLGLHFLRCQLQFDQRADEIPVAECLEKNPIANPSSSEALEKAVQTCIGDLDRGIYDTFYSGLTYVDSMCQFLQNSHFRDSMDKMVQRMAIAGKDASKTLFDVLKRTHDLGNGIAKISEHQEQELEHLAKVLGFLLENTKLAERHQQTLTNSEDKLNHLSDAMRLLHSLQLNFSQAQQDMADQVSLELEHHSGKLTKLNDNVATVSSGVDKANSMSLKLADNQASQLKELLEMVTALGLLNDKQQEAATKAKALLAEVEGVHGSVGGLRKSFTELEGATAIIERVVSLLTEKQESFFSTLDKVLEVLRRLESLTGDVSGTIHVLFSILMYGCVFFFTFLVSFHKRLAHGRGGLFWTVAVTFAVEVYLWTQGASAIRQLAANTVGTEAGGLSPLPALAVLGSLWPWGASHAADALSLDVALDQLKQGQWILRYSAAIVLFLQGFRTARRYKTSEERMMEVVRKAIRLEQTDSLQISATPTRSGSARRSQPQPKKVSTVDAETASTASSNAPLSEFDDEADGEAVAPETTATRKGRSTTSSTGAKRSSSSRKQQKTRS